MTAAKDSVLERRLIALIELIALIGVVGVVPMLARGVEPQAVLTELLANDQGRGSRQVGVIDMHGHAAAHTGKQNLSKQ